MQKRKLDDISEVIIHCSGTDRDQDIESIRRWHQWIGWEDVGYHFFIRKDGTLEIGRPIDVVGAHVKGYNSKTIGICLSGSEKFTEIQFIAAGLLVDTLARFVKNHRECWILPHNAYNKGKTCPNFDLSRIARYSLQNPQAFFSAIV